MQVETLYTSISMKLELSLLLHLVAIDFFHGLDACLIY